ncbi:MAG: ABC transporter ATP-binding protein [Lachnospiraceae bacterium]|nr:ABC transporter ATP-binding protein [Lachnospiraceae bacterium]MDY5741942.1 ABC transporter ATP-binding protein [Lachnospiraceae bacterium]
MERGSSGIVHVEDLTMAYDHRPVLWDVDLDIVQNSITAIIGPNGAGKSTLIKGILELMKPISGSVRIMNQSYRQVYRQIAYIPQSGSVNWGFPTTVADVVLMGRYGHLGLFRRPRSADKQAAEAALERMKMTEFADRQIAQLSGGQRQRVFLARAIAQDARIYFMDEPLQGVDRVTEEIIIETMREFQRSGKTIVAVHHDLATVERYFDHVVMIDQQIIAAGRTAEVFTEDNLQKTFGGM